MSLQVWLPLNGSLDNQGLTPVTVTVSGSTAFNTSGKIGQSLTCNGSSYWIINPITLSNTKASICCWVKTSINDKMIWVIEATSSNKLNLWQYQGVYYLNTGDSTQNPFVNNGTNVTGFTDGQWHHLAVVFDNDICKIYKDGIYAGAATTFKSPVTSSTNTIKIAGGYTNIHTYDWNGSINDVRIYDHALSAQEVKKLAQGLILHYPLASPTDFLVPEGYQQLEYIESAGASYTDTGYKFNAETDSCKVIMKGNDTNNNGMIFASSGTPYFWLYYYKGANTIGLWADSGSGQKSVSGIAVDTNKHTLEYKNHQYYIDGVNKGTLAGTHTTTNTNIYLFSYSASTSYPFKGRIYYADIYRNGIAQRLYVPVKKLSDNAIGLYDVINKTFIQSTSGTAFTAGPNAPVSNPVYDISGFKNHGTVVGSLTAAAGSPRYKSCTYFNGSSCIQFNPESLSETNSMTVSLWIKPTAANNGSKCFFSLENGTYWQLTLYNTSSRIRDNSIGISGTGKDFSLNSFTANTWVHIAITYSSGTLTIYRNGSKLSGSPYSVGGTAFNVINQGRLGSAVQDGYYWDGFMSDVRIYATALSYDDIKELYALGSA